MKKSNTLFEMYTKLLKDRRSCHHFTPKKIERNDLIKIAEAVSLTPSGYNLQPWEIHFFESDEAKTTIQKIAYDQPHVSTASALCVLIGDTDIASQSSRILHEWIEHGYIQEEQRSAYKNSIAKNRSQQTKDIMIIRNCSLAAMNIMLAAQSLGIDSCPMMGFNKPQLIEYMNLPEHKIPIMLIPLGYNDHTKEPPRLPRKPYPTFTSFDT